MAILVGILFLHHRHRCSCLRRSVAQSDRRKIHDRGRLSTRSRLALDRQRNPRRRASVAFQVLQWKFRRLQPPAFCSGTPQPDRLTRRPNSSPASNAVHSRFFASDSPPRACMHIGAARQFSSQSPRSAGRLCHRLGRHLRPYISMGRSRTLPGQPDLSVIEWSVATFGLLVAVAMIADESRARDPGHFNAYEWLALGVWVALGAIARRRAAAH